MSVAGPRRRIRRRRRCVACPHRRHVLRCAAPGPGLVTAGGVYATCCGCSGSPRPAPAVDDREEAF